MRLKLFIFSCCVILFSGCVDNTNLSTPTDTNGENNSSLNIKKESSNSYGYYPIDPLPIKTYNFHDKNITNDEILDVLPNETMRLAVGEIDGNGAITFGPAKVGYENKNYVVVLDYAKFDTKPLLVKFPKDSKDQRNLKKATLTRYAKEADLIVPTYVGVGLRLTANLYVKKGSVDLGSLFALGLAAQSKNISGTLVVQTLGISGKSISPIIPMPSEISTTTIQNAIMALGTIKSKLYDNDDINIKPRVIGVYNNLGGGENTINDFISLILQQKQYLKVED